MSITKMIMKSNDSIYGKGTDAESIHLAEQQLSLSFCAEYKEYLTSFGTAMVDGHELTGIGKVQRTNVVGVTKEEWKANSLVPHNMYVIEQLNIDGIVIWQDGSGNIYQSSPFCPTKRICDSLTEYLFSESVM